MRFLLLIQVSVVIWLDIVYIYFVLPSVINKFDEFGGQGGGERLCLCISFGEQGGGERLCLCVSFGGQGGGERLFMCLVFNS